MYSHTHTVCTYIHILYMVKVVLLCCYYCCRDDTKVVTQCGVMSENVTLLTANRQLISEPTYKQT